MAGSIVNLASLARDTATDTGRANRLGQIETALPTRQNCSYCDVRRLRLGAFQNRSLVAKVIVAPCNLVPLA